MITTPTLFILGAGASYPYGYPTGLGLRENICANTYKRIQKYARQPDSPGGQEANKLLDKSKKFVEAFRRSQNESIDLFLARNKEFSEVGKVAIALELVYRESKSTFPEGMECHWYRHLFGEMTKELISPDSFRDIEKNKVSFITFNYDRSLEHFLYDSLAHSFVSAEKEDIARYLSTIPIIHTYGVLGKLPWQAGKREYSAPYDFSNIWEMKNNIKTIYERTESENKNIKRLISEAKRIFFLGFGFGQENIEILGTKMTNHQETMVYGTALGSTELEIRKIKSNFQDQRDYRIRFFDMDCLKLLREEMT